MKYIIFGIISVLISINTSARETNSIRSSYELVGIGDSESDLLRKIGKPYPRYFIYKEGRYTCAATEYIYDIDMQIYTVWVCNGKVFKIDVANK
ncbi:hypothetical protein [Acinetobacter beijerinckii]|uniref:DUF2845 domain-containing protein n=1 Tax=Acinetobacter beijerinckii CIP 110307 TaxID=1217648 RepID=N9FKA4_9GAMM|nr:hypothetical protein [Acinetobacter beijerinckii]ENW07745.1 hypothetical protein F933_00941 [Acinetobacter beijerinckii CIP 110307]